MVSFKKSNNILHVNTKKIRTITTISMLYFGILINSSVYSMPVFNQNECKTFSSEIQNWPNSGSQIYSSGQPIYYYIEQDFGRELKSCLQNSSWDISIPTLSDAEADDYLVKSIISAAEIWNQESVGAFLVYAGTVNINAAYDNCSLFTKKPSIFIKFENGCKKLSGINACEGVNRIDGDYLGPSASVERNGVICDNMVEIRVYGDRNTVGSCDESDGDPLDILPNVSSGINPWSINGSNSDSSLIGTLVHEFGHTLGLGHPQSVNPDPTYGYSVMQDNLDYIEERHLWPWDYDCVDDSTNYLPSGKRNYLRYSYRGFNSSGSFVSDNNLSYLTRKGTISGGWVGLNGSNFYDLYYSQLSSSKIYKSSVGTDGSFSFSYSNDVTSYLNDLYHAPTFMSPLEFSGTNHSHRSNYLSYVTSKPSSGSQYALVEPPKISYYRSDNHFSSGINSEYLECNNINCTSTSILRSNIPLSSAWNNVENKTIFAKVNTQRFSPSTYQKIKIHIGYAGFSDTLSYGHTVETNNINITPHVLDPDWEYQIETDNPVGIACAPNQSTFSYNCILSWIDRGVWTNNIVYTYFKINGSSIEFLNTNPNAWHVPSTGYTGVSAAFFDDSFWLTWKNSRTNNVEYVKIDGCENCSSNVNIINSEKVADRPTWFYVPHQTKESSLVWTEIQ
jgi:hypothetical protein